MAVYSVSRMVLVPSGMPRWNTSRPSRLRVISCAAASRMASSRIRRNDRRRASSSALGFVALAGLARQQQPRLEVREPRRHDEIVGGKLEPQLLRLADEAEILVGERQHGDLGEVDLLRARQRQQQIERALEAGDVDDERVLVVEVSVDDGLLPRRYGLVRWLRLGSHRRLTAHNLG